jgi:hypothetical protein
MGLAMDWSSIPPIVSKWTSPAGSCVFISHMLAASLGSMFPLPVGYLIAFLGWPSVFYTVCSREWWKLLHCVLTGGII